MFVYQCFISIYKAFGWVAEGVPKKAIESKKRGANPDFSSFRVGYWLLYVVQTG